jgi:hypothetical protein
MIPRPRVVLVVLALVALTAPLVGWAGDGRAAAEDRAPAVAAEAPEPDLRRAVPIVLAHRAAAIGEPLPTGQDEDAPPYRTGPGEGSPEVVPPPPLASGTGALYAVGDSVLLGAEPYLRTTLAGWDVRLDGRVSRGVPEGFELVRVNRDRIGDVLVLVLGHNYGGGGRFGPWLEAVLAQTSDVQRVVLVTVTEWSPAQREVNRAIRAAPARHDNVVVADWAAVVAANPQFLRDHVHTSRSGAIALANLVAVMAGPSPRRDGAAPPRPRLLPIPDEPVRVRVPAPATAPGPTTPTGPGTSPTTASAPSTTATTVPASTSSTSSVPPTTAAPTTTVPADPEAGAD